MRKTIAVAVAALALGLAGAADAKTLKLQASSAPGDWAHRFMTEGWQQKVGIMSGGSLMVEVLPTKAVVPHKETIDAVANGILDGDLNAVAYFSGRDPAFALMGDLIAGYDTPEEVQAFCMEGGGKEVLQKLYDKYGGGNIHVVGCGPYAKEALVSKVPIKTVEDFKGVKIRSPEGLAAEVFKRAGASPVSLPFSEVYTSLEKGIVDAADASAYVNNDASGMHKVALYPLYPGIHSMAILQFVVNKDVWTKLTDAERTILETWYVAAYVTMRRQADLQDRELAARDRAAGKLTIIDWSKEERAKFRKIAVQAWQDYASKSPLAQEALDAHLSFMKKTGLLD
ncbi:MAG: TRAP transporter substrate-binding protein [Thalassobaculum sp.]|uniref:TRAP transporter substrate-binding protein n=1 Tax=Thalassobaculum sp. TaxID=2022740 RepID=UPI0032EBE3DD